MQYSVGKLTTLAFVILCLPAIAAEKQSIKVKEALQFLYSSQPDKSAAMARAALKTDPKAAQWHEILALSSPWKEEQHAFTALSISPSNARLITTCSLLEFQHGKVHEALRLAQQAVKNDPENGRACAVLATCEDAIGNDIEAERLFAKAVRSSPLEHDVNFLAATYYVHESNDTEAASAFHRLEQTYPHSAEFLVLRGKDKRAKKDLVGALRDFDLAIKLEPTNLAAVAVRAKVLAQLGRHEEASAGFEKWTQIQSDSARAHMHLAKDSLNRGDIDKAIPAFDRAIELANQPKSGSIFLPTQTQLSRREYELCWIKRMELCDKKGKSALAIAQATAMLKSDPRSNAALEVRQNLLRKTGRYSEAIDDLTRLIALDNDVSDWYRYRAEAYRKVNQPAKAESDLARAKHIERFGK